MPPNHKLENRLTEIGERLRQIRHSKSEKLTTVASALNVHYATMSKIENGTYNLTVDFLDQILRHYGMSLDNFFDKHIQ